MPEHDSIFDQFVLVNHKEQIIYVELKKWDRPKNEIGLKPVPEVEHQVLAQKDLNDLNNVGGIKDTKPIEAGPRITISLETKKKIEVVYAGDHVCWIERRENSEQWLCVQYVLEAKNYHGNLYA